MGQDVYLGDVTALALSEIKTALEMSILEHAGNSTADRLSLVKIYTLRSHHIAQRKLTIHGFEATLRSLAKATCERVQLITVSLRERTITIILDPNGAVIGCYISAVKGSPIRARVNR